jgi:hypothetical protein
MGIGKLKLNTILNDTIVINSEQSNVNRKIKEIQIFEVDKYDANEFYVLKNLQVMTFKGYIFFISFDIDSETELMLNLLFEIEIDYDDQKRYKSKNAKQKIIGDFNKNKAYFIDESINEKINTLKLKGL